MTRKLQSGITLMELLVVMTLIAVLTAVAAPSVGSGVETVRLRSASERLAATFRTAHERAMRTHHYQEVSVDPQSRAVELRDLESGSVASWDIPAAVVVKAEQRVAFLVYPDGGTAAMRVTLENARGRQTEIVMDPFTLVPAVREVSK